MAEKTVPNTQTQTPPAQEGTRAQNRYVAPPVDIYELEDKLVVVSDIPGATNESLDVSVENNVLTIQARTDRQTPGRPVYREFDTVNFYRQFELAETVDAERISAELKNGVLTLHLPKAEKAKPRRINVTVS